LSAYCLSFNLPAGSLDAFEAVFEPLGGAIVTGGRDAKGLVPWQLYLAEAPEQAEIERLVEIARDVTGIDAPLGYSLDRLPETDWVAESQKSLPPIIAGRFRIRGSHVTEPPPPGAFDLLIDANAAFGTGRHETTRGCLLALQDLVKRCPPNRPVSPVLDMGCGSGVLAMAAAKLRPCLVLGVDNDAPSIDVARQNVRANGVGDAVSLICADGFRDARVAQAGPFALIFANILAEPLCRMAREVARHLAPGGFVILSGLLTTQERQVQARYRAAGLTLCHRYRLAEWSTLVLKRG
jgi:ribosomal protein L11 methyltransferase